MKPYIVSVDDHVVEPASTWYGRLPAKLRDRGPRAVDTPDGVVWQLDGERFPLSGSSATVGIPPESRTRVFHWDTVRPGCFDPVERVKDMDIDGVLASLCFPSFPGFGGTRFNALTDRELALACIQAYNDFQIDEWSAAAPGRLFPMVLLPYWDPAVAVRELQRCAGRGAVAVAFSENPYRQGFPSLHDPDRYWDPLFAAAQEAHIPFCLHFGSSSWVFSSAPDAPHIVTMVASPLNSAFHFIDWIFSGVFERWPGFQVVFSESYLGWIPFILEHADKDWENHYAFGFDRRALPLPPSEYFRRNVSVCLVYDTFGAEQIERIGVDRVLAESDYPHSDSQWPNTRDVLEASLSHLASGDRMKVLRTNAERLFELDLADAGA